MKRSKMLDKLYEWLKSTMTLEYNNWTNDFIKLDAEELLELIEDAGMLPPKYLKEKDKYFPALEVFSGVKVNEWEPEEDKDESI